jgi:hypothetical protein
VRDLADLGDVGCGHLETVAGDFLDDREEGDFLDDRMRRATSSMTG